MTTTENTSTTLSNGSLTGLYTIGWLGIALGALGIILGIGGGSDYSTGELNNGVWLFIGMGALATGVLSLLLALTVSALTWKPGAPEKEWRAAPPTTPVD